MASYIFVSQDQAWLQKQTLSLSGVDDWQQLAQLPDTLIYSETKNLGIELIRSVTAHLSQRPYQGERSMVIIEHADLLTQQAQHAFLKLLEEPPVYATIVLWTPDVEALLPTIRSRCFINEGQQVSSTLDLLDDQTIENFLAMTVGQRFQALESAKDKTVAQTWIKSIAHYHHERLKQLNPGPTSTQKIVLIHQLIYFQELLAKSVQPRFICEQISMLL